MVTFNYSDVLVYAVMLWIIRRVLH